MATNRENLERLLRAEAPDIDLSDDDAVCAQIVADYEDYARLLTLEQEMQEAKSDYARLCKKEQEMDQAIAEAEARGRNCTIEAAFKADITDGIPHLSGASAAHTRGLSLFDIARM